MPPVKHAGFQMADLLYAGLGAGLILLMCLYVYALDGV
jgi:hypothetical protein